MGFIKAVTAVAAATALIWNVPTYGANNKSLPQPFPFGTQHPTSMTYMIFIDDQPYEDYMVTFHYDPEGKLMIGEYESGPNCGTLDYQYEDGKLVARADSLSDHKVYFLYDEEGMIYAADESLESGSNLKEEHDITYHYDDYGRLSYAEETILHAGSESGETERTSMYIRFNYSFHEYVQWQKEKTKGGKASL